MFSGPVYQYQFNAGDPKMFFDATGGAGSSSVLFTDDFASIYINTGRAPGPLDDARGSERVSDGCSSYTGTRDTVLYFQLYFSDFLDSSTNKAVSTTVKVSPHDCSTSLLKTIGIIAGIVVGVCAVIACAVGIGYFLRRQETRRWKSRMTGNGVGAVESTNPLGGVELSAARGSSTPPALPVHPCPPAPAAGTSGASKTIQIQIN